MRVEFLSVFKFDAVDHVESLLKYLSFFILGERLQLGGLLFFRGLLFPEILLEFIGLCIENDLISEGPVFPVLLVLN